MLKYPFIIALALGCAAHQDPPMPPPTTVTISVQQARTAALAAVPGQIHSEKIDSEHGRWVYEFEIQPTTTAMTKREVDVDAATGAVLEIQEND
jgi:uncharacterized membrane protein YkoI